MSPHFFDFDTVIPNHVRYFSLGLMCGADIIIVSKLIKYVNALQNDNKLQELFIAETDERNIMIRTKTGGTAINIIMAVLVCAAIIAGIFNKVVFYTLIATLLFVALLKLTLKLYYRRST